MNRQHLERNEASNITADGRFFIPELLTHGQASTGLNTFNLGEAFYAEHYDLIRQPISLIDMYPVRQPETASGGKHGLPPARIGYIALAFDATDTTRNWYGWQLRYGHQRYDLHANRKGDRYAVRYEIDGQAGLLRRDVIDDIKVLSEIHASVHKLIAHKHTTETIAKLMVVRAKSAAIVETHQRLESEQGLTRKEQKTLQAALSQLEHSGFPAIPWRTLKNHQPRL